MCHACTILCTDCEHHGSRNRYLILERNPLHKYTSLENACDRLPKKRVRKSLPKSGSDFAPRFQNNNDSPVKGIRAQFLTSIFGANSATSFLAPKKIWSRIPLPDLVRPCPSARPEPMSSYARPTRSQQAPTTLPTPMKHPSFAAQRYSLKKAHCPSAHR